MSRVTKPDLGGGISHPARYSLALLPVLANALEGCETVLDPFAGTGRIHLLRTYGFETTGIELQPKWAQLHPDTIVGDATDLPFDDRTFDAVCTSPCYGNRMADHHNAKDGSVRRTYTHDHGEPLHPNNAGAMQWGDEYRKLHIAAWQEASRVLKIGGRLVLNVKDHQRKGVRQNVAGWHVSYLCRNGFSLLHHEEVSTPNLRVGENTALRFPEQVYVFQNDDAWAAG